MTATARRLNITEDMIKKRPRGGGAGTGTWEEIVVPNNYRLVCSNVEDYEGKDGKPGGWIVYHEIETSTGPCIFRTWLSFSVKARWKLVDVFEAHGIDLRRVGVADADPKDLLGTACGGFVDFPRDRSGEPTSDYRDIIEFFPLVEEEDIAEPVSAEEPFEPGTAPDTELEEPEVL